jgi:hypothetical protein
MNEVEKAEKLYRLLDDLAWEFQRMTTSGQSTLNEIYEMVGIEPILPEDTLDFQYMINRVEDK